MDAYRYEETMSDGSTAHNVIMETITGEDVKFACDSKQSALELVEILNRCAYIELI